MKKTLLIGAITTSLAVLTGCGGDSNPTAALETGAALAATTDAVPPQSETTDAASIDLTEVSDTKSLTVAKDFSFATAQHIDIAFDLESARDTDASVSICTSYMEDASGYDIDYDSCSVRGPMVGGVFNHSMEITNEFDSVVAVVWFLDPSMQPMYQEFSIDTPLATSDRSTMSLNQRRVIVWK